MTAALSLAILIAAVGSYIGENVRVKKASALIDSREPAEMQQYVAIEDANGNGVPDWQDELEGGGIAISASSTASTTESQDPASKVGGTLVKSLVGGYLSLQQSDSYTPARGEQLANNILSNLREPATSAVYTETELKIDSDISEGRILKYRADMRAATAPMVDLNAEPEFSLFARFISSGDEAWLEKLSIATAPYREVEKTLLDVEVPSSAVTVHLRTVNAVGKYAETLERLVRFAHDPLALMTLLRTYNEAEREFLLAFDALAKYYVQNASDN